MNQKNYQKTILEVKLQIVVEINQIIDDLIIPGVIDYVELPNRICIISSLGEDMDDCIFGVRKNQAIINSMFNETTPFLITLPVEMLIDILGQVKKYKTENY